MIYLNSYKHDMHIIMKLFWALLLRLIIRKSCDLKRHMKENDIMSKRSVVLANTETYLIGSKYVADDFKIDVSLPKGYYESSEKYPVLYVLDGNRNFGIVAGTVELLHTGMDAPKMIIVGIGYKTDEEHSKFRSRDYLPTISKNLEYSGGASNFLSFLEEELIPNIESSYRVDSIRVLAGISYSGLFTMYALFNKPSLFNNYLIGSPSMYYDNEVIFKYEEEYARKNDDLDANVFLSVGSLEAGFDMFPGMVSNVEKLSLVLKNRKYNKLKLTTCLFENETHFSVMPATFSRGIRELIGSLALK